MVQKYGKMVAVLDLLVAVFDLLNLGNLISFQLVITTCGRSWKSCSGSSKKKKKVQQVLYPLLESRVKSKLGGV